VSASLACWPPRPMRPRHYSLPKYVVLIMGKHRNALFAAIKSPQKSIPTRVNAASALDAPPRSPEYALTPAHNRDHGQANAVNADVLRDLTNHDLKKLGVLLGHRPKLLRAIAALDSALGPASAPQICRE
jgi:hypothetical protein